MYADVLVSDDDTVECVCRDGWWETEEGTASWIGYEIYKECVGFLAATDNEDNVGIDNILVVTDCTARCHEQQQVQYAAFAGQKSKRTPLCLYNYTERIEIFISAHLFPLICLHLSLSEWIGLPSFRRMTNSYSHITVKFLYTVTLV